MIHSTAIIDSNAKLHPSVKVGAYSVIGSDVEIGEGCEIKQHVVIEGPTKIGSNCRIFPFASIGMEPQDKKFGGEKALLIIGDNNTIRESVTINRGTDGGGGKTVVGSNNWIMAYCHIAHDCIIGDDVIMANCATLGGHVEVGDNAVLGGLTAVHQFCKIGPYAMTGGQSMVAQDVTPYTVVFGNRAKVSGINMTGLERAGFSKDELKNIKKGYKLFFMRGLTKDKAVQELENEFPESEKLKVFIDFIKSSERGICR